MKTKNRILILIVSVVLMTYFLPKLRQKDSRIYIPTVILESLENEQGSQSDREPGYGSQSDRIDGRAQSIFSSSIDDKHETTTQPLNTLLITPSCSPSTLNSEFKDFTTSKQSFWDSIPQSHLDNYRKEWQDYVNNVTNTLIYTPSSRGIIIACSPSLLKKTLKLIWLLTSLKYDLPIQIWHNSELSSKDIDTLTNSSILVSVHCLVKKEYILDGGKLFQIKIESIIQSSLDYIIFLDSDNIPLKNPSFLFDREELKTGAMFWPDYWKTVPGNPIWKVMGIECVDEYEQESGQMVIHKSHPGIYKSLLLTLYLQSHSSLYFKLLLGDKDTFRLSFRALSQSFHMVPDRVRPIGGENGKFRGHSMAQSLDGKVLFVHANLLKYKNKGDFDGKVFGRIESGGVAVFEEMAIYMVDNGDEVVKREEFKSQVDLEAFYQMEM